MVKSDEEVDEEGKKEKSLIKDQRLAMSLILDHNNT